MAKIKKFKLPRGVDPLKREFKPAGAWSIMVLVGGGAFFALFLWSYFYLLRIASLEDRAVAESAAEIMKVVDQDDLHQAIELIEAKEQRLASSTPTIIDPSR